MSLVDTSAFARTYTDGATQNIDEYVGVLREPLVDTCDLATNPYRADFPLLAGEPAFTYLDSAATAQRPALVLDAQRTFYQTMNANALRGLYRHSQHATAAIEGTRLHLAQFFGTNKPEEYIFVRNATEALNLAAHSLPRVVELGAGDEVCITIMEHHSNLIPWQQACKRSGATLVYLRPDEQGVISEAELNEKISARTKIVAAAHVSNVLGVENPIAAIAQRAHDVGALMVVDGAQAAPHLMVDIPSLECDFYAISAHKMFGPMGIGVAWGKADLLARMEPMLTGGEMIDSVREDTAVWAPVPMKFEAGTQDGAGIVALDAAMTYLEAVGRKNAEARERALTRLLMERLSELDYIEVLGPANPDAHVAVVSFNVRGIHPHDVSSLLDEYDVAIRAGHHCAEPLLRWMSVPSSCRASVALYNDASDIDRLIAALEAVWRTFHGNR